MLRANSIKIVLITTALLITLGACSKLADKEAAPAPAPETNSDLKWARAALERNPELKVESVDEAKRTISVRVKATGEIVSVSPGELAAIPIGDLVALTREHRSAETSASTPQVIEEPVAADTQAAPENVARKSSDLKVERDGSRVHISGPGVNIESTGAAEATSSGMQLKKYNEPIICEGQRTLFLDRRRMTVDGDAIIARNGCELHLTNSEINATGTAVVVKDATVHIGNSTIQGSDASIDLAATAKLFAQNAQFIGISRRDPQAKITDQGGNTWR
jgi:hypothetical protein